MRYNKHKKYFELPQDEINWQKAVDKFKSKVEILPNECWLWKQGKNCKGYGMSHLFGKRDFAHRISWILHNRSLIPTDMQILHKCKIPNRACVNPEHLKLGTAKENTADMIAQGNHYANPPKLKGEDHPRSVLVENDVKEIRRLFRSGYNKTVIAFRFGVNRGTVRDILSGKTWKWLE